MCQRQGGGWLSTKGLAWLGRLCTNKVLRQGALDNMMDDEFQNAVLEPFIDQVRAAPAELERLRMEASTQQAARPSKPGLRL